MPGGSILHIMQTEKFIEPYISFVQDNFENFEKSHKFFIAGNQDRFPYKPRANIVPAKNGRVGRLKHLFSLAIAIQNADQVVLHGLFDAWIVILLSLMPWNLKKCCWVIWGGDLYVYQLGNRSLAWRRNEVFRRFVIKRLGLITTTVPGDFDLAKLWYSTRARFIQNIIYPSHIARVVGVKVDGRESLIVQIGNSADPSNNHFEIIDKLSALVMPTNSRVIAPLSYGDMDYAQQVIDYGKIKLGEKFLTITRYMDFSDYNKYMSTVSIVILNHKRQQAMGNTIGLLSLGKKVYLRSDVTQWAYLKNLGLHVYDSTKDIGLEPIGLSSAKNNVDICKTEFSNEKLLSSWRKVFGVEL